MKYFIAVLLVVIIGGGVWYGVGIQRRKQMLASGRPLLLVNSKNHVYSYSDLLQPDDITTAFKIVGYADEMTSSQIADATQGLQLVVGVQANPGDPRVLPAAGSAVVVPTDAQQKAWVTAIARLPKPQQDLCAKLMEPNFTDDCLADHLIWQLVKESAAISACNVFYNPLHEHTCRTEVLAKDLAGFADANNNSLIDGFESMALPYDQQVNSYNLPVVNPAE